MKTYLIIVVAAGVPLLAACSGGSNNHGDTAAMQPNALCPASLDYSTVWTGGAASGELVKVQLDTTKMTWQVTYLESVVPSATGTAEPTRQGQVQSGTLTRETTLPTPNLNACAYRLNNAYVTATSGNGVDTFDNGAAQPARVLIGQGIMGGMLPGKEIQFGGINIGSEVADNMPGLSILQGLLAGIGLSSELPSVIDTMTGLGVVGTIPDTTFRYFPFLAFSTLDNSLATLAANKNYTQLGMSLLMTANASGSNFSLNPINAKWTINSDGSYTKCDTYGQNAGACVASNAVDPNDNTSTVNHPFALSTNGSGAFESDNYQGQEPPYQFGALPNALFPGVNATAGKAFLLLGKMPSGDVPLLIRRGVVNVPTMLGGPDGNVAHVDDEVGISLLMPQTAVAQGSIDGEYVLVDSTLNATAQNPGGAGNQFNYRALLVSGSEATLLDPFNPSDASIATALNIGYAGSTPGLLNVNRVGGNGAAAGNMIFGNGAMAYLDATNPSAPYFAAGAFVQ